MKTENLELKFRVWDKVQGIYLGNGRGFTFKELYSYRPLYDDLIFQQFTGLKDKNNKEIYIGDIVICRAMNSSNKVIVKDIRQLPTQLNWPEIYKTWPGGADLEVVGNIFESLEEKTENKTVETEYKNHV